MPMLMNYLRAIEARRAQQEAQQKAYSKQQAAEIKALVGGIAESQATQAVQLQLLTSGNLTFRLDIPVAARQLPPALMPVDNGSSRLYVCLR